MFGLYIDDHLSLAKSFADIFKFLHKIYFLYIVFGLVYFIGKKIFIFDNKLNILDFEKTSKRLKPFSKYQNKLRIRPLLQTTKTWMFFFG